MAITAIAALFLAAAASPPAASSSACYDKETQMEMNVCAAGEFEKADRALNRTYAQVMTKLGNDKRGQELLRSAQRAWIVFRDGECTFQTNLSEGGSVHSMVVSMCMLGFTAQRTRELNEYLKCKEGDFSCPVW